MAAAVPTAEGTSGPAGPRARVLAELAARREVLQGPDGVDPVLSNRPSAGEDALELNAACLALPEYARELGKSGTPLLWSWPARMYRIGAERRAELLEAAALLVAAVERLDVAAAGRRRRLRVVDPRDAAWTETSPAAANSTT